VEYVALIFFFAFVYNNCFAGNFYHSTLKYEVEYDKLKNDVLKDIHAAIMSNFSSANNSYTKIIPSKYSNTYLHIDAIHLYNLDVNNDGLHFIGHFYYSDMYHHGPGRWLPTTYNYIFNLRANSRTIAKSVFSETREISVETTPDNPIDSKYLLPSINETTSPSIHFNKSQLESINKLIDYSNGIIRKNSFIRMLYFSAVTISTIGYGDIVPIDDTLRLLVGFEAILGIVFIGLFINALGDRFRSKKEE